MEPYCDYSEIAVIRGVYSGDSGFNIRRKREGPDEDNLPAFDCNRIQCRRDSRG